MQIEPSGGGDEGGGGGDSVSVWFRWIAGIPISDA